MQLSLKVPRAIAGISAISAAAVVLSAGAAFSQSIQTTPTDGGSSSSIQTTPTYGAGNDVVIIDHNQNGFGGAYVGGGIAAGVTNGGQKATSALFGGNIQGRIAPIPNVPVSARAAILFGGNNSAIMPMVTYDIPVARNTNVYVGGGYAFVERNGEPTPLGNQSGGVLTLGAESSVTRDIVVYGDAKLGINTYKNSPAQALSLQAGLGYRF